MELQCIIRNIFVNEQPLASRNAIPNQRNEVLVMNSTDGLNLCLELTLALSAPCFQLLDGDFLAVWKHSSVHVTEATLSEEISIREAIGCHGQFFVSEGAF